MAAIKLFLVFYRRATSVAGSLIEISDCQGLHTFHRRADVSSSSPFLCGVWRSAEHRQPFSKFDSILIRGTKVGYESWDVTWAFFDIFWSGIQLLQKRKKNLPLMKLFVSVRVLQVWFPYNAGKKIVSVVKIFLLPVQIFYYPVFLDSLFSIHVQWPASPFPNFKIH